MTLTLREAARLFDWERFCDLTGFDYYARAEGGDDVQTSITVEQALQLLGRATVPTTDGEVNK